MTQVISPGKTIGILGGGQLALMLILFGARLLYYKVVVWDPNPDSPAFKVADHYICAEYNDEKAFAEFSRMVDVVTYEFENVSAKLLMRLEEAGIPVRPKSSVLVSTNNRLNEKRMFQEVGFPALPYDFPSDDGKVPDRFFPGMLKTISGGYDGKGQAVVRSVAEMRSVWNDRFRREPAIIEPVVNFMSEVSVVVARSLAGDVRAYPAVTNRHENGILRETAWPGLRIPMRATEIATAVACGLDAVGVITIEMFLTDDNELIPNECAPRVHNSGHWTIEGAATSQFEQHVRAICGLPLGDTHATWEGRMLNLLGDEILAAEHDWADNPNAFVHNYGKKDVRPGRKMGHVTIRNRKIA